MADSHSHDEGVEEEGVDIPVVIGTSIGLALFLIFSIAGIIQVIKLDLAQRNNALADGASYTELREEHARTAERLERYSVVDPSTGTYQIPIDRASELVIQRYNR